MLGPIAALALTFASYAAVYFGAKLICVAIERRLRAPSRPARGVPDDVQ